MLNDGSSLFAAWLPRSPADQIGQIQSHWAKGERRDDAPSSGNDLGRVEQQGGRAKSGAPDFSARETEPRERSQACVSDRKTRNPHCSTIRFFDRVIEPSSAVPRNGIDTGRKRCRKSGNRRPAANGDLRSWAKTSVVACWKCSCCSPSNPATHRYRSSPDVRDQSYCCTSAAKIAAPTLPPDTPLIAKR